MTKADLNLLGKDYLTREEAAHYCCVSLSQFETQHRCYGLLPFRFMGRVVFRKVDIQAAMESQWQRYTESGSAFAGIAGPSTTTLLDAVTDLPSVRSRRQRPRRDVNRLSSASHGEPQSA